MTKKLTTTFILIVLTLISAFAFGGAASASDTGGCASDVDHFTVGKAQYAARNLQSAISSFDCAIKAQPNRAQLYYWRGKAYCANRQSDIAAQNYQQAIDLDPDYALAWNNLGWANYLLENYDVAMDSLNTAIDLDPTLGYAYNNRGLVYLAYNEVEKATADFEKAVDLGMVHPWASINLYNITTFGTPAVEVAEAQ